MIGPEWPEWAGGLWPPIYYSPKISDALEYIAGIKYLRIRLLLYVKNTFTMVLNLKASHSAAGRCGGGVFGHLADSKIVASMVDDIQELCRIQRLKMAIVPFSAGLQASEVVGLDGVKSVVFDRIASAAA